jgi:hypothetical protein
MGIISVKAGDLQPTAAQLQRSVLEIKSRAPDLSGTCRREAPRIFPDGEAWAHHRRKRFAPGAPTWDQANE